MRTMAARWGRLGAWAAAAAAAVAGAGCTTAEKRQYTLEVPAPTRLLAVDVENFRGRVEVRADRGGDAVRLAARVRAGSSDQSERKAAAEAVEVDAEIEEVEGRGTLRVRTWTTDPGAGHAVDLLIQVPRCDGLRVVNDGGDVEVVGTGGAAWIENRFGAIELRTARELSEDVTLLAVDGNIFLQVPPGSRGRFDLETLAGESVVRDRVGGTDGTYSTGPTLATTVGGGQNTILARTNRGDIRVWLMEDPEALTRLIKTTAPNTGDLLFLKGSRRSTRNLPDDAERESIPGGTGLPRGAGGSPR
jgi:hypothetical protein